MIQKQLKLIGRKMKSFRYWPALIIALLALVLAISVVQASGPRKPPHPSGRGGWGMPTRPWWPMTPVPEISIVAVEENSTVTFETKNFPEDEDFVVTMGYIYTRGKNGYEVGTFNSADGEPQELTFDIPQELQDEYRIAIRAQTDHTFPYYAFNWFYNNSTNGNVNGNASATAAEDASAPDSADEVETEAESEAAAGQMLMATVLNGEEVEEVVPSFQICEVSKNASVSIVTADFPEDKDFAVKMGIMPNNAKMETHFDGKMKRPKDGMEMSGKDGMEMSRKDGIEMSRDGRPPSPMPPMKQQGKDYGKKPSGIWIPYYEAGSFNSGDGGVLEEKFEIPSQLTGTYRVSILLISDDMYPYFSYNWFYNNDATDACTR